MRRNDGDRQKDGFGRFQNPLSQLNFTVQILLSARSIEDNADKLAYIWDTIDLVARFLLESDTSRRPVIQCNSTSSAEFDQLELGRIADECSSTLDQSNNTGCLQFVVCSMGLGGF